MAPACVSACPEGAIAIEIVNIAEWRADYLTANAPGLPSADDSISTTRVTLPQNLLPDMGRVDFMYAQKEHSTAMLDRATEHWVLGHNVKVLQVEDIIGLKVLSSTNDLERAAKDLWDIEDLMRRFHKKLDWQLVRDYFKLFDREAEFKRLKKKTS